MSEPFGVVVDKAGNLYVSDYYNNRVLKFAHAASRSTGAAADAVLGQTDFISHGDAISQTGLDAPSGVAVDQGGNLYVVDAGNDRVLKFSNAGSKPSGAPADVAFGERDFTSVSYGYVTDSTFYYPLGAAVNDAGTLYVADYDENRIMLFSNAATAGNGPRADVVLGQSDFTEDNRGASAAMMNSPQAVAVNSSTGTLYVADLLNNRVLVFNSTGPLAVQLYEFTSSLRESGHVALQWSTATETNNYGFYVQRKSSASGAFIDPPDNFVAGHGTTLQPQSYSWIDTTAGPGTQYYRLKQVDLDGAFSYSKTIAIRVSGVEGVRTTKGLPKEFSLSQNYPNPFNPGTTIEYALPKAAHVRLTLYNMLGEKVSAIVDEDEEAGYKSARFDGSKLSSGAYFYELTAGSFSSVKKILLMK